MIRTALSGRKAHSLRISRHRGFSLVELMMSIVLLAIGLALALPSYRDMVEKRQVTNGAEQVASFINTAQGVAMKTNQVVTVSYSRSATDEWCLGATLGETACDCTVTDDTATDYCEVDSQPFIIENSHAGDRELVHDISGGGYAFDPVRGLFTDLDDGLTVDLRSQSEKFQLSLVVNNTGRVTLCSASAQHSVPGYGLCAAQLTEEDTSGAGS